MANKVKFGLRNVYYSKITVTGGVYSYGTPVKIDGAVNLTLSPTGDRTDFYADDIIYFSQTANNGYEGELEVALLPDSFKTDILGQTSDVNGALIENADDTLSHFALGFEVQGDDKARRTWLYEVVPGRPNGDAPTKEATITPQTDTLPITVVARSSDYAVKVSMTETALNTAKFAAFFSNVYEKESASV